ncbi:MAG: hypothetical protein KAX39_05255 [candidate division Zixibacteria bacterium]|nr:hypothetical protein [candidate division Zixibacteria bacterium]
MKLFDDIKRNENRPKHYSEPRFSYLNRSARPEFERIRNLLEQWFKHILVKVQPELRSRFRQKDDRQHLSAFFELYLYELLFRLRFDIEFHPKIKGKKTHPDFMVSKGGEQLFYLEATLTTLSDTEVATKAREKQVYDTLNTMESPNFFIYLKIHGTPGTAPPGRRIRSFLERKLAQLDPNKITRLFEIDNLRAIPSWEFKHQDWRITFRPFPKSPAKRGKPIVRPIGLQMQETILCASDIGIIDSIKRKASKYGKLDLPYVIALDILDECDADESDISIALYGKEPFTDISPRDYSAELVVESQLNAAWYGQNGSQHTRVSAALIAVDLVPSGIAKVIPTLWHNPWANYPMSQDVWPLPQVVPNYENNQLVKLHGKNSWELLELSPCWPNNCKNV